MTTGRILAIDDEVSILSLLTRALENEGFEVLTATDGEKGLETIRTEHPDLVISDILMPRIDGLELIQMMRKDPFIASTPFIMLSGKGTIADQIKGLELGADDYIAKPFEMNLLVVRVKAMLRQVELLKKKTETAAQGPFAEEGLELFASHKFEDFIIGDENRKAYEAAKDVSERPGWRFNPLFLYGGPGRGKTHLMCAVANAAFERDNSIRALYLTSQVFSDQILDAYENRKVEELKRSYLQSDMFFIDDIQFLAISPSLQAVAADILSAMYNNERQIMICSDRRPEEIRSITTEISRRFGVGLVGEIGPPTAALRSTILRTKARKKNWPIPDLLLDRIANRVISDVRTLEGIAKKLVAMQALGGVSIDEKIVDDVIRQVSETSVKSDPTPGSGETRDRGSAAAGADKVSDSMDRTAEAAGHLVKELSRELQVMRAWGLPEEVGPEIPRVGAQPVIVLGTSGALVADVVDALSGLEGQMSLIPEGDRWAYLVHRDCSRPKWILMGTNQWRKGDELDKAIDGNKKPVFLVMLDSPTPRIPEVRNLIASIPSDRGLVVVFVASLVEYYQDKGARGILLTSMRKLFRIPEEAPLVLASVVNGHDCREWLRIALHHGNR